MEKNVYAKPRPRSWLGKYAKPFGIIPASVRKLPGALGWTPSVTAVYFNLFLRGGPTNWKAYPAVNTIAQETHLDRRTVQRALRVLVNARVIRLVPKCASDDSGVGVPSNVYDLRPVVKVLDELALGFVSSDDPPSGHDAEVDDDGPEFDDDGWPSLDDGGHTPSLDGEVLASWA